MTTTATLHITRYEDHEYDGTCGTCGREGLRWIVVLSDGSRVGVECTKRVLGWKPAPRDYTWVAGMTVAAEATRYGATFAVWAPATGHRFIVTQDGRPVASGPETFARQQFADYTR
jgi:hypothetical protein